MARYIFGRAAPLCITPYVPKHSLSLDDSSLLKLCRGDYEQDIVTENGTQMRELELLVQSVVRSVDHVLRRDVWTMFLTSPPYTAFMSGNETRSLLTHLKTQPITSDMIVVNCRRPDDVDFSASATTLSEADQSLSSPSIPSRTENYICSLRAMKKRLSQIHGPSHATQDRTIPGEVRDRYKIQVVSTHGQAPGG